MAWDELKYSLTQVDRAGATLVSSSSTPAQLASAYAVIGNWRSFHQRPLRSISRMVRRRAHVTDENFAFGSRIKTIEAIEFKLQRETTRLTQMQDVGGCRAIVRSVKTAEELVEIITTARFAHELVTRI